MLLQQSGGSLLGRREALVFPSLSDKDRGRVSREIQNALWEFRAALCFPHLSGPSKKQPITHSEASP